MVDHCMITKHRFGEDDASGWLCNYQTFSNEIPSSDLFKKLKWLPFPKHMEYQLAVTVCKTLDELNPHYMDNHINSYGT